MQTTRARGAIWAITVPATIALLAGCSVLPGSHGTITVSGAAGPALSTTPGAAPTTAAAPTKATSTSSPASDPGSTAGGSTKPTTPPVVAKGCPAGGAAVPQSASIAHTQDLDGDGLTDTLWLAVRGNDRVLGVTTASGARFSTVFQNAAPTTANAVAGRLGDGTAVILLDFSREAVLYVVTGCRIVPSLNAQGRQYSFDEGFTGYGSGAGCPQLGHGRRLVGYLAKPDSTGDRYVVTRTIINFSQHGTRATNGKAETIGDGLPGTSSVVSRAQQIICGPGERALEPAS